MVTRCQCTCTIYSVTCCIYTHTVYTMYAKTVITYSTCIQCTLITASILDLCLQLVIWSSDVGDCLIWYVHVSVGLMTSLVISNLLMSVGTHS